MAQNKSAQATKRSSGPKANPDVRGDVGKSAEKSEAGRARKKAEKTLRDADRKRRQEEAAAKQKEEIEKRWKSALPPTKVIDCLYPGAEVRFDEDILVAVDGVDCAGATVSGSVLVQLEPGRNGQAPVLRVVMSNFPLLPASDVFLPVVFLLSDNFRPANTVSEVTARQQLAMYGFLKKVLHGDIAAYKKVEAMNFGRGISTKASVLPSAAAKPVAPVQKKEVVAIVPEAQVKERVRYVPFRPERLQGGECATYIAAKEGTAYFHFTTEAGADKLKLVHVTPNHQLEALLEQFGTIKVDAGPILKIGSQPAEGDMYNLRVARVVVQNFVREHLIRIGYQYEGQVTTTA